ncbi:TraI protein [Legionella busanensis]|uniref:TraI protein n=1 Tax=Legionella busanensis TaxID=190655 RepID=A0A378JIV1_9GAMM|nr:TraI/MobA(P) family conjugative relaxase [Legionella busanensis]STX50150.1 TraI protein [Legionella busanensis]
MIIRHIPMKAARLSSFSSLVQYLCDEQNKMVRVGRISISNCNSDEPIWAVQEVLATQAKNQRAKNDKTYHMLISFAPGEILSNAALQGIEERVVAAIGFKEHQRISVVHHDTDNLHIHVAINKINPITFNMVEPFRAYKTFAEIGTKLEIEFGLKKTNHQTRKSRSENLADDMEQHSGIESLINWMKQHCKEKIAAANSWIEIHNILAEHGLAMQVRANGFVFCNHQGLTVKASSISRNFSKKNLETKLGAFASSPLENTAPTSNVYRYEPLNKNVLGSELYTRYQHEKARNKIFLTKQLKQLREAKILLIAKAKKRGRMKRAAFKLMKISRINKRYLYQKISKTLIKDITQLQENYAKARSHLIDKHQNKTWADWLRQKAQEGDQDALTALRYRNRKNKNDYTLSGNGTVFSSANIEQIDSVTKEGTQIYKTDKGVIRDSGKEIKIYKGASVPTLKKAIEMAKQKYDNCIQVNGSPLFKKVILEITVKHNISITFADPDMETQRIRMTSKQEINDERSQRFNDGRGTSRSNEIIRAAHRERRQQNFRAKPNVISLRQGPPAEGQNSLRDLSELNMVQLARRSKVLLQGNAHDKLERQRLQPDNNVRWKVFRIKKKSQKY